MITFIDEKGTEHSALVAYSVTNAVNGELSVKGTIYTNDKILHGIGRGWRFRLDDEYYRITYAKPNDTGRQIEVEFDAVHQFFYDMSKSMVYTTLNGSKPFETYLQVVFSNSGYTYNLETTVGSIRKENFGNKSRLSLFNDIIKAAGLEFSVRGHVVRILKRIGTDLSTIVRKDFNMNELKIEKDINSFVTYQRGLGAWKDDEDHSKGRYEASYESPLSAIYGRIEADPVVDERYKDIGKLLERLKENVDKSYKVSVEIDMEDLSQAGYRISRPNPGDYIMAINENLGFRQKVRIVSFTSEYDVGGNLISRKVVCNDIGTVQRATSEISHLSRTLTDSIEGSERALKTATRALVSADGKNTNYFGDVKPLDVPKGILRKGDRLFLTVGEKKQLYFWNGAEWELEPTEFDHEKFDMEFNRKSQEIKKAIQENRQTAIEALRNAGASSLLAQEAKRIGLDSVAKLEEFKRQSTSAQTALSDDLDALKQTVTSEVNQASEYRRTTTEALSRMTGQMDGFATKSEVRQDVAGLTETFVKLKTDTTNLISGAKSEITLAKTEFKKTADGLSAKMSAVESYVGQDGQRQEALRRYTREESAKQATSVRELVTRDYVGKSAYQEDVRGIEHRLEAITNPQNGSIATQIAKYKTAVDGRFADITSMISGKANQTDFQRVRETSQLYERILGNTENGITDKVARMAMTNQLFQVEVAKAAKGGRNYIRNGQFKNGSKNWLEFQSVNFGLNFNYQHSLANRNRPGLHFYHDSQDVAYYFGIQQSFAFEGVRGEKVSVSLLVSKDGGDSNSGLKVALHYIKNKNIIGQEWQSIPSTQITSKYKRFTFTFTLSDDVENLNLMLYGEKGKTINLYVTDVQLERGSVATDYKEAPEDTEEAIRTVQTQLAGSWSVQNINSAGDIISGINLGSNGRNRITGKATHITGETLIDNAVIKSAMIDKLKTANFEAGSVTTVILDAEAVTAEKIKVDQALFNKLVANEAYLSQLFAKQAFINRVQSVAIDASQVRSGILSGDRIYGGTIRGTNIFGGTLTGHTKIQLGSYGSFDTVNGGLQINVPRDYNSKDGLGVQFIGSYGRGENVPYGLFVYKDSDFTIGNTATDTNEFIMTVEGYIKAKGIGWLKTGLGKVGSVSTGTLAFWKSTVALDFAPNDIYYTYGGQAYGLWAIIKQNFSDRRLKENIVDCKHKALDYIYQFQFKEYDWKKQEDRQKQAHTNIGLIAQEVQAVDPTLVYENGDTLNLDNLRLTNIALKAIQELALENKTLTQRLENLENERRTA
nr:MAG TPA: tail protein [Caudoviricetes sp.]